jgi:hypothetical protein
MIMDNDNTAWRGNSQDPGSGNPALKGGEGSYPYRVVLLFVVSDLFSALGIYMCLPEHRSIAKLPGRALQGRGRSIIEIIKRSHKLGDPRRASLGAK